MFILFSISINKSWNFVDSKKFFVKIAACVAVRFHFEGSAFSVTIQSEY